MTTVSFNGITSSSTWPRRTVLAPGARGVTLGALATAVGCSDSGDMSGGSIVGSACLTILYRNGENLTFDYKYYRDNHMARIMNLYTTDAISRFEVRKPGPLPEGAMPAFLGTINFYLEDRAAFDAAGAEPTPARVADVANFSSVLPVVIPGEIYGLHA